jgi:SAM-dependent methyltransferase
MGHDDWEPPERTCAACGLPELGERNRLCPEGFDDATLLHLRCFNSPTARAWREQRRAADPVYDRYCRLQSTRSPIICRHCGANLELYVKGVGMGASEWTANCINCHRVGRRSVSPYSEHWAWMVIADVCHDYVRARGLNTIPARIRAMAKRFEWLVDSGPCECGGRFSLAAPVRCLRCDGVLLNSCFHTVQEPLTEERRRRVEEMMSRTVETPTDWDDADAWERYYAAPSSFPSARDQWRETGSIGPEPLAALVGDLRTRGRQGVWFPGCGLSPLPRAMAAFGFHAHATDWSATAVQSQRGQDGDRDVNRLVQKVVELGQPLGDAPGEFVAAVHDFRTPYLDAAFDLIVNQRAYQGLPRPSMERAAASHAASLRPGGLAIFDTMNVQGDRRDELEGCLVAAGFHVPLFEANRRLRRALAATNIPHVFILGRPMIPAVGPYAADMAKRQADTAVLRGIFTEHEERWPAEYQAERERAGADAKVATVIYSTG